MKYLICIFYLFNCLNSFCQDVKDNNTKKNTIGLYSGIGFSAIRNEYYDKDKYSGAILPFGITWENQGVKNSWKIYATINSGRIKTINDDAEIKNGSLGFDLCFPIHYFTLFKNNAKLFIGPSTFLDAHIREQKKIALDYYNSGVGTLSIGPNIALKGSTTNKLHFSTALRFNVFSLVGQSQFGTGFMSINKAFLLSSNFSLNRQIHENIYLGISYQSNYINIRRWTPFVSGSDFLLLNINFKL